MKVIINLIKNMEKEFLLGQVAIYTRAIISKMRDMAMDKCFGPMVACTKESGQKVSNMV